MSEVFANGMNVNISIRPENANDNAPIQITVLPPAEGPKGEPGFSPKASVKKTDTGAVITVEDEKGVTSAAIENGKDGKDGTAGVPGADGFSPIAKVVKTANGARVEITDKNGTTSAEIKNGADGTQGPPGQKGDPGDDNVFVVKLTFDEDYNFVVDKTHAEVKQAVADGKAVIMLDVEVGTTLLYMGEGDMDGERCPFFVSPLSEVGMTALWTNVVYLKESGEVAYTSGPPINPLIIHYRDEQYTFDGSKLLSLNIKDDVFVIRVDANGKADQTQEAAIAAKEAGKAVLLVMGNGEVLTYTFMDVHPDYPSDLSPVFVSSIYGDFGETKYRSLAYLLADKTVVTRTEAINTSGGSGGTFETPTDEEIIQTLIDTNFLLAVTDSDGAILTDADGAILMM